MQESINTSIELTIVKIAGTSIFQAGNAWGQCQQFGHGRSARSTKINGNQSLAESSGLLE